MNRGLPLLSRRSEIIGPGMGTMPGRPGGPKPKKRVQKIKTMKPTSPASNGNSAFATLVLPTVSGIKRMLLDKGAYRKRFVGNGPEQKSNIISMPKGPGTLIDQYRSADANNTEFGGELTIRLATAKHEGLREA